MRSPSVVSSRSLAGRRLALVGLLTLVGAAGCSGGGGSSGGERLGKRELPKACGLFDALDASAAQVKAADPADPVAFAATIDAAAKAYSKGLDELRPELPADLQVKLDSLKVLVDAHDFAGAAAARGPFDDWVIDNCS